MGAVGNPAGASGIRLGAANGYEKTVSVVHSLDVMVPSAGVDDDRAMDEMGFPR